MKYLLISLLIIAISMIVVGMDVHSPHDKSMAIMAKGYCLHEFQVADP
jgi:ABC-type transport system involved in cytochrome bd biosynthesis fused ATPase/permease subunit